MRGCAIEFNGAVLLDDLEDRKPSGIHLFHIVAAHCNIGACDCIARGGVLGKEAELGNCLFALNPTGNRHRILFYELRIDELFTTTGFEPLISRHSSHISRPMAEGATLVILVQKDSGLCA